MLAPLFYHSSRLAILDKASAIFKPQRIALNIHFQHYNNLKLVRAMTSTSSTQNLVAVCQLNCKFDKETNFKSSQTIITQAANAGARMIFLPECFDFIAPSKKDLVKTAETIEGDIINRYKKLAKENKVWLSLGGLHQRTNSTATDGKVLNAHIVINDEGNIRQIYHKLHLFNLDIPNVVRLVESEAYIAGDKLDSPVDTPVGKLGLGICYDLRFPELAIAYAKGGAEILTYPSSFTVPTGTYHWEPLLRARAIENQCYVVAAAQVGNHNEKRSSFGHAMIVDPWGSIVAQCSDGEGFALAIIDKNFLKSCRTKLPVWTDRRTDLYASIEPAGKLKQAIDEKSEYKFGDINIPSSQVFCLTKYSFAFVNHRPVLDGHMLVSPLRVCKKFSQLSPEEVSDLMLLVQRVEKVIEREKQTESTTITIQDGVDAGQSVYHVHVHLLPRKPSDFGGNIDKIYRELQRHDKAEFKKDYRKLSPEEMTEISKNLRKQLDN